MRKLTQTLLSALFLLTISLSATAQSQADVKQKIEKMNKEMAQAMIAGDHEKNLQYYTDNVVSLPSYEKMLQGKDAIRKSMEEMEKSDWKVKDFNFETVSVEQNGNMVTEIGKYRMEMNKKGSTEMMKDEGKYVTLWEKQPDGSYKIKTEIWNSDLNPWAQMKDHEKMMGESHDRDMDMDMDKDMHKDMDKKMDNQKMKDSKWDSKKNDSIK